ncbi:MAG: DNA-directed RNA polymerase subunit beta, partial [Chloroflexi bacterium]|nr:DNA-directed RNA polymerase subunit beta [Chloroflexota bacterium]
MAFPILATPEKRELQRKSYARIPQVLDIPNLIQVQLDSFEWFKGEGLRELFQEVSPIQDTPGKRFELRFLEHYFEAPKHSEWECRQRENTYAAPLYARAQLVVRETGERKEQKVFLGDVPMMTDQGTFVINGAERVVVSQLVRSPGIYFTLEEDPATGRSLCYAKLIPYRGAWLEFETSPRDILWVKVDRKRKTPVTTLLRAVGLGSNEELVELFREVDTNPEHPYLRTTLARETQGPGRTTQGSHYRQEGLQRMWELLRRSAPYDREAAESLADALMEFYRRLRPGEPPSLENAQALLMNLFFTPRRYDLGRVGRYKMNRSLELDIPMEMRVLTSEDIVAVVRTMIQVNNGRRSSDDIDHLGNRRVRAVGELIQNQLRVGLLRMERVVRERMTIIDAEQATPSALVNIRPIVAAVREFFGGSQLSQFMDQTNPLAELTHKRRLSALGPGGLSRERAGFDVRDVHHSHYGRICPIETPEGPNIGLLGSMATYARINQFGFIETPYRKVIHELPNDSPDLMGRTLLQDVKDRRGRALLKAGGVVTSQTARRIRESPAQSIRVKASVSPEVRYLSADEEEHFSIAQANSLLDARNQFRDERVEIRHGERFDTVPPEQVDYMDVSPMQIFSVSTALIPFLEHDDANRALMGSNMQRQAVPLL